MLLFHTQPQKELQLSLKKNNTQNGQIIELYRSPTTKDLKKRRGEENTVWHREAAGVEWVVPHSCVMDKNLEGYLGSKQSQLQAKPHIPGF